MSMDNLSYTYEKQRKEFGGAYTFEDKEFTTVDIRPDAELLDCVTVLETVDKTSCITKEMAEHDVSI